MRSVRLDDALESRLEEAARLEGKPVSSIIREAIDAHCEIILGQRLADRVRDVAGIVRGGGGRARRTGEAFRTVLRKRRAKR